jgi:hypothetical protein
MNTCLSCGKKLIAKQINKAHRKGREASFCSLDCSRSYGEKIAPKLFCKTCGKKLTLHQVTMAKCKGREDVFCSPECFKNRIELMNYPKIFCGTCNKKLTRRQIQKSLHRSNRLPKYCSPKCASKVNSKLPVPLERRQIISQKLIGHTVSDKCRRASGLAARLAIKKRLEEKGILIPNFNITACEYFKKFDEKNKTLGEYALYGGGEHFISELGYWTDYFNSNLKLIIEWDEESHYKPCKSRKDAQRQKEITELFTDYDFIRIREKYKDNYSYNYTELLSSEVNKNS